MLLPLLAPPNPQGRRKQHAHARHGNGNVWVSHVNHEEQLSRESGVVRLSLREVLPYLLMREMGGWGGGGIQLLLPTYAHSQKRMQSKKQKKHFLLFKTKASTLSQAHTHTISLGRRLSQPLRPHVFRRAAAYMCMTHCTTVLLMFREQKSRRVIQNRSDTYYPSIYCLSQG